MYVVGFASTSLRAARAQMPLGDLGRGALGPAELHADPVGEQVGDHEADVVPILRVLGAGIAEPDHEPRRVVIASLPSSKPTAIARTRSATLTAPPRMPPNSRQLRLSPDRRTRHAARTQAGSASSPAASAASAVLGRSVSRPRLQVGGARRVVDDHDDQLRVGGELDAGRQLQVAGGDVRTGLEALDRRLDVLGQLGRVRDDRDASAARG